MAANNLPLIASQALKQHGVEKFVPLGEQFDPNLHTAFFEMPDPSKEPGTVGAVTKVTPFTCEPFAERIVTLTSLAGQCWRATSSPALGDLESNIVVLDAEWVQAERAAHTASRGGGGACAAGRKVTAVDGLPSEGLGAARLEDSIVFSDLIQGVAHLCCPIYELMTGG